MTVHGDGAESLRTAAARPIHKTDDIDIKSEVDIGTQNEDADTSI